MHISKIIYWSYSLARKAAKLTGQTAFLRRKLGPVIVPFFFRISAKTKETFSVHGHDMVLASQGKYPPIDMVMGTYEKHTYRLFEELVRQQMVVIDIGAHVGYYTLLAARRVGPTGKVYAFEPEPANHSLLIKNIQLNEYRNIEAIQGAVTDRVGSSKLFLTDSYNGTHSTYRRNSDNGSVAVDTTTLDAFLESREWPDVGLIKVDVEGAEIDVMKGMAQLVERSPNLKLIMEFNPSELKSGGADPLQFFDQLAAWGFKAHRIQEAHGLASLETSQLPSLVEELVTHGTSINIFCFRSDYIP